MRALYSYGKVFEVLGDDFMAIAMCHEYDHLDGILYKDKQLSEEDMEGYEVE